MRPAIQVIVLLASFLIFSPTSYAEAKTIWSCTAGNPTKNVLWLVEWGAKSYVKVFDDRIPATYSMDGIKKRWDWGLDKTDWTYDYAVVLGVDGIARYHDFSAVKDGEKVMSQSSYRCTK